MLKRIFIPSLFVLTSFACVSLPFGSANPVLKYFKIKQDKQVSIYLIKKKVYFEDINRPFIGQSKIFTGLDALEKADFILLKNKKFALLANLSSRNYRLRHILSLLLSKGIKPSLLLTPEHGLYGNTEDYVKTDSQKANGGIKVVSLYSKDKKQPDEKDLKGIDLIVVDIVNLPVRCYTYISTLTLLMEAAEKYNIKILILDRPNPYGLFKPAGPYLRKEFQSFTALAPVPFLYSLTLGEYAYFMANTRFKKLKLGIVKAGNYERDNYRFLFTRPWISPSPNIPTPLAALTYAGMALLERTNLSVGRGTTRPFIYTGAPWLKGEEVLRRLNQLNLPGVVFNAVNFTPTDSKYKGIPCGGIQINPVSRDFQPIRTAYEYIRILYSLYPGKFLLYEKKKERDLNGIWGAEGLKEAIQANIPYETFKKSWNKEAKDFEERTKQYRLY